MYVPNVLTSQSCGQKLNVPSVVGTVAQSQNWWEDESLKSNKVLLLFIVTCEEPHPYADFDCKLVSCCILLFICSFPKKKKKKLIPTLFFFVVCSRFSHQKVESEWNILKWTLEGETIFQYLLNTIGVINAIFILTANNRVSQSTEQCANTI